MSWPGIRLRGIVLATLVVSVLQASPAVSFAQAGDNQNNPMIFPPDSEPYGMTYGEWTAVWWKWFLSLPTEENPINDPTGELCDSSQSGQVWFLVGSGGGEAERSCEVPAGKAILIPAIIVECSKAEDESLQTEADLRACAKSDQDLVTDVWATVNDAEIPDEQVYRVDSPLFNFSFIADNVISAPEGPTEAVSDGFWLFLKPLPPGNYDIHVGGILQEGDPTVTTPFTFVEDSTYHLTVVAPPSFTTRTEAVTISGESASFSLGSSAEASEIQFDEEAKQLSFSSSGGITTISISSLLEGPYTITVDGEQTTDYGVYENEETGETILTMVYDEGTHETVITGTNVVPEFPLSIFLLVAAVMSAVVIAGRAKLNFFKTF